MSTQQLFNNNLKLTPEGQDNKLNRLKTHFYGYGGYRFTMVSNFVIEPSILLRQVVSGPFQLDLSGRVIYNEQIWGGLSVRNTFKSFDDLSLIFGYIHEHRIHISIAYDFSFAKIARYTAGTIELVLGYDFDIPPSRRGR
jgi:type IX secretion system PorP/SprF family membrane protein